MSSRLAKIIFGVLLAGSVVANAVLVVRHQRLPAAPTEGRTASVGKAQLAPARSADVAATASEEASPWAKIPSAELRTLADRLSADGVPAELMRLVLQRVSQESIAQRRLAFANRSELAPFWKSGPPFQGPFRNDSEAQVALRELVREQSEVQRALSEMEDASQPRAVAAIQRQYGELPEAKIEAIQRIQRDYEELRNQVRADRAGSANGPGEQAKLALLEREQRADLETTLTAEELFEHDVRSSRTASQLRGRLGGFEPTEEEFRAIYRAQSAREKGQQGASAAPSPRIDYSPHALVAELEGVLSPERLATLRLTGDPSFGMVSRVINRLGLPPDTTRQVLALEREAQQRVGALRGNRTLSADEKTAHLAELGAEARSRLTQTLGPRGVEAYEEFAGSWLRPLSGQTPTLPPAPVR